MDRERPPYGELIIWLVLTGLFLFLLVSTWEIQQLGIYTRFGARLWPQMVLVAALLVCVSLIVSYVRAVKRGGKTPKPEGPEALRPLSLSIGAFFLYASGLMYVGFLVATPLYMAGFMAVLGMRRWTYLVLGSVGITAALNFLFVQVMALPLPKGMGVFRDLSSVLY